MMNRYRTVFALAALLAMAACKAPSASEYFSRGGPETLLDVSSEVVNLSVADASALSELSSWIKGDQPTRAELYCNAGEPRCNEATQLLSLHGVPTMVVPSSDYSVALVYERILARDCRQRFVDNHDNSWNRNHAAFGCSVAANTVQHVSNKQQFVSPNLTDTPGATGAVQAYERAYTPPASAPQAGDVSESLTNSAQSE